MSSTLDDGHAQDEPCSLDSCGLNPCEPDDDGCMVREHSIVVGTADFEVDGMALCHCPWHQP